MRGSSPRMTRDPDFSKRSPHERSDMRGAAVINPLEFGYRPTRISLCSCGYHANAADDNVLAQMSRCDSGR
jgi:hypothetical protein